MGGTNTRVALIDEAFHIVKREQFLTDQEDAWETIYKIKDAADRFQVQAQGVGIS